MRSPLRGEHELCFLVGHISFHAPVFPNRTESCSYKSKSKPKSHYDRQSVGQSVLVSGIHLERAINFSFSSKCSLDSCGVCYFVAPSLTRGRVCNLLLLLVLASSDPRDSRPHFIVPILETPPTWRVRSPYLYPPGTGWPSYTPRHWVSFPSPLTTCRATVKVFYPASTRDLQLLIYIYI
jgi:hypothetical protein